MFKILGSIPNGHFHVAASGGEDSMVLVDFLLKYPRNSFDILHFNHGTEYCDEAESFVRGFCERNGIPLHVGRLSGKIQKGESREAFWRRCRYGFLDRFRDEPILMAHHLNDCIETWVMTSLDGKPRLIPYHNELHNTYRPFLLVPKSQIEDWTRRHRVKHVFDGSNDDIRIRRNYVRHVMMKDILHVNPGIGKCIAKLVQDSLPSIRQPSIFVTTRKGN